ncbi:MAG: serine/threonine protein kinase [Myxococcaceae bacterium]|jgi:serine/threonine protein kinase|nr:serine/threonine protein kinase [Myxococcaceae bacterium]
MNPHAELPEDVPSMAGEVIGGKYRVDRLLGSGGMGTVWLGAHAALGTPVAIKFIRPSHAAHVDARKRFEIEARATAKLSTKHAVHVFDYGTTDEGIPYIVMEYLEGESLSEKLIREGPMNGLEVARMIRQAARALTKAHAAGIVHRDLKPDNIFLCSNVDDTGDELTYIVKLVDFGIAKIFQEPLVSDRVAMPMGGPTMEGAVIGTPNFMSPEQLTLGGMPGALTDLWSLGACAFAAMTARIPFEGDVLGDIVLKVCASPLPVASHLNPDVPPGFDAWFARACSRDAKKRFQTPSELADALDRVCGVVRASSPSLVDDVESVQYRLKPATPEALAALEEMEEPQSMSSRTAMLAGIVLTVALAVCALGVMAYRDKLKSEEVAPPSPPALPAPPVSK